MKWQPLFQFRISSLLWLMVVVAAAVSGYRAGLQERVARQQPGRVFVKTYAVKDLVWGPGMTKPDFQSLIDVLMLLSPQKWSVNGGDGNVTGYDNTLCLAVAQDAATHRQIERKLAALRRLQSSRWAWLNGFVAWLHNDDDET